MGMVGGARALQPGPGHAPVPAMGVGHVDAHVEVAGCAGGVQGAGDGMLAGLLERRRDDKRGWCGHRHHTGWGSVADLWRAQVLPYEAPWLFAPFGLQQSPDVHSLG